MPAQPHPLSFRTATIDDAEPLSAAVVEGLEDYRSFAGPDWSPPSVETEVEHLRNLFVHRDLCGTGLARRFYEREGWTPAGEAFFDPVPKLEIIEYRYTLPG